MKYIPSFVRVERRFDISSDRVLDAFLKPEIVGKWLFTGPTSEKHTVELEAKAGGKWTIMDRREGKDYTAIGEYLEIRKRSIRHRLVFTFGMPQFSDECDLIVVEIVPEDETNKAANLTLTQLGVAKGTEEPTASGWGGMMEGLAAALKNSG